MQAKIKKIGWLLVLSFLSISSFGQPIEQFEGNDDTIDKGTGIMYFSGLPGILPDTSITSYDSELGLNTVAGELYYYDRTVGQWQRMSGIRKGYADVSGDPGTRSKLHLNLTNGVLKRWDGSTWVGVGEGDAQVQNFTSLNAGSSVTVTVATLPNDLDKLKVYRNGIAQRRGNDYSVSGQQINFLLRNFQNGETVRAEF